MNITVSNFSQVAQWVETHQKRETAEASSPFRGATARAAGLKRWVLFSRTYEPTVKLIEKVNIRSRDGEQIMKVALSTLFNAMGVRNARCQKSQFFTPDEAAAKILARIESSALPRPQMVQEPDWKAMEGVISNCKESSINKLHKSELLETIQKLKGNWKEVAEFGQWDDEQKVLHLRPQETGRAWMLPRAVEIHFTEEGPQIYVLHKGYRRGNKTKKLGTGAFKETARSVHLGTLKGYVHATIDIDEKTAGFEMKPGEVMAYLKNEIALQKLFKEESEFVTIAHTNQYVDKNGNDKIGIMMELCNGGELFDACADHTQGIGKVLNNDLRHLVQVIEDMLAMLVKLEEKGVINTDIKLENLFLHQDEKGNVRLKMGDFGLAFFLEEARARVVRGHASGSPDYVAPEYVHKKNCGYYNHIWEMGFSLHILLTGYMIFQDGISVLKGNATQEEINLNIEKAITDKKYGSAFFDSLNKKPAYKAFLFDLCLTMVQLEHNDRPSAAKLLSRLKSFKKDLPIV